MGHQDGDLMKHESHATTQKGRFQMKRGGGGEMQREVKIWYHIGHG